MGQSYLATSHRNRHLQQANTKTVSWPWLSTTVHLMEAMVTAPLPPPMASLVLYGYGEIRITTEYQNLRSWPPCRREGLRLLRLATRPQSLWTQKGKKFFYCPRRE